MFDFGIFVKILAELRDLKSSLKFQSHIITFLCLLQITRILTLPSTYLEPSYSKVRVQKPTIGLSVENEMAMEMLNNPELADEKPSLTDKVDSIFQKGDQIKNVKSMNIDLESIMASINNMEALQEEDEMTEARVLGEVVEDLKMMEEEDEGMDAI